MTTAQKTPTHDWNGNSGENWVTHQLRLDRMLQPFGDAAMAAALARPGESILDIGCGAGVTSFALAEQAGAGGHVLGVDISPQLIARARHDAPKGAWIDFQLADAATAPLSQGAFDLIFSRFGVMFFDDPAAAFAHMRRALKTDGRLAFVCWRAAQDNDWVRLPMAAIRDIVPPAPTDPAAPGPFAFADPERVSTILAAAGFADIAVTPFDATIHYGYGDTRDAAIDDALGLAFAVGPLSRALAGQPDDVRGRAAAAVRAAFAARPGDTSVLIDGAAWIVTARNRAG